MSDVLRYSSYEELGAALKAKNPSLTKSAEEVGRWYARKRPDQVMVTQPPGGVAPAAPETAARITGGQTGGYETGAAGRAGAGRAILDALAGGAKAVSQDISSISNAVELAQRGIGQLNQNAGLGLKAISDLGRGAGSGYAFGADRAIDRMMGNPPQEGGAFYEAGRLVGEIAGPYKYARMFFGLKPVAGTLSKLPGAAFAAQNSQLLPVLRGSAQAGSVEGAKALVRGEEPWSDIAIGFAIGGFGEASLRGWARTARWGISKWISPETGEIDMEMVSLWKKYGLPMIPTIMRPFSGAAKHFQDRVTHTAVTRKVLQNTHEELVEGMSRIRNNLELRLGENAAVLSPTAVGRAIHEEIDQTSKLLLLKSSMAYDDIMTTEIRNVPIQPNREFTRVFMDDLTGEQRTETTSILKGFKDALGPALDKDPSPAINPVMRRLARQYRWLEKNSYVTHPERKALEKTPSMGLRQSMAQPEEIEYRSYQWWWDQRKIIGSLLDERAVRENPTLRQVVLRIYHTIQDGIDETAMSVNPVFEPPITQARAFHENWIAYNKMKLVKGVLRYGEDGASATDHTKAVDQLFHSPDAIAEAKRILTPRAFNSARQGWIRDLLWDSLELDDNGAVTMISPKKLFNKMNNMPGAENGEFIRAVFSDDGFMDAAGNAIPAQTDAAAKYADFNEFVRVLRSIDTALRGVVPSGEQLQGGKALERVSPGIVLGTISSMSNYARQLLANIIIMKKGASEYLVPEFEQNYFLDKALPYMGEGNIPIPGEAIRRKLGFRQIPGEVRQSATSAAANRLINRE